MRKPKRSLYAIHPFSLPGHVILGDDFAAKHGLSERVGTVTVEEGLYKPAPQRKGVFRLPHPPSNMPKAEPLTTEQQATAYCFHPDAEKTVDAMQNDPARLYATAMQCMAQLAGLGRNHGNAQALWLYAQAACEIGQGLSDMMANDRKAFVPIARTQARWPLMRSTHPLNCDPDSWLSDIALGSAHRAICLDRFSKWKVGFAATYAVRLYEHLDQLRKQNIKIDGRPIKDVLPDLNKDTAPEWWEYAWQFLLHTYPEPEKVKELNRLVTAPTKRRSPGRIKQAIHDILKARFVGMAKP